MKPDWERCRISIKYTKRDVVDLIQKYVSDAVTSDDVFRYNALIISPVLKRRMEQMIDFMENDFERAIAMDIIYAKPNLFAGDDYKNGILDQDSIRATMAWLRLVDPISPYRVLYS